MMPGRIFSNTTTNGYPESEDRESDLEMMAKNGQARRVDDEESSSRQDDDNYEKDQDSRSVASESNELHGEEHVSSKESKGGSNEVTVSSSDEGEDDAYSVSTNDDKNQSSKSDTEKRDDADGVDAQRDELLDKFMTYCSRISGADGVSSPVWFREKYRLTDLLQRFVDDNFRPFGGTSQIGGGPLTFRKCLEKTGFTVPSSITFPPSQVVDVLVETPGEKTMKDICGIPAKVDTPAEIMAHRSEFCQYPSPNMTRFLYDIGYSLVSEVAYKSVLTKAVSELSSGSASSSEASAVERQAQMVEKVRQIYEDARKQNQPLKLKQYHCPVESCDYTTDTHLQLYEHQRKPHKVTYRWLCAICQKFSSWSDEDVEEHYMYEHGFTSSAKWDPPSSRAQCSFCDLDFQFKWQLKNHVRECPMNVRRVILTGGKEDTMDMLNMYLWPKLKEDRRPTTIQTQQQKLNSGAEMGPRSNRTSSLSSGRVADVVELVAAGKGHLRSPPKTVIATAPSSNLPRIFPAPAPATALRTVQTGQSHHLPNLRPAFPSIQPQRPRPAILTQAASVGLLQQKIQQRPTALTPVTFMCEICDNTYSKKLDYLKHLQMEHKKLLDKSEMDLMGAAPLACSRCRDRFYSYEGLERHLLMEHNLVTNELLSKAQKRQDSGKCRLCGRMYAFNLLQHLVQDHQRTLCSAEIVYSCDVCHYQCNSYIQLESHLRSHHANQAPSSSKSNSAVTTSQQHGYNQASNALTMIAQRQQQAMFLVQQPHRSAAPQRQSIQPQSAAAVLSAALSNKRALPAESTSTKADQPERPPKLMKMTAGAGKTNQASAGARGTLVSRPSRPMAATAQATRKQLRYCCTPCDLKFVSYEAVLKHWVERHLKPLRVPVCRIDECQPCQEKLTKDGEEQSDISSTDDATKYSGLKLDLEPPDPYDEKELEMKDDDVEILPSPGDVICLD